MPNANTPTKRVERDARLRWVPIPKMRVSENAQRELNQNRAVELANSLDLEQLGTPTVNERDGLFYIIDGQHRIEALRIFGLGDDSVQCWTYVGLTPEEEAEKFLKLNDTLTVDGYSKFKVAVQAGRSIETDIDRIVRAQGLRVARFGSPGAISTVGTLRRVYDRDGAAVLARTLVVIRDGYGDDAFTAALVDGVSLVVGRYDGALNTEVLVQRLNNASGGLTGLFNRAERMRMTVGAPKAHCVAAAVVDTYNRGRGGKKLASWWKD